MARRETDRQTQQSLIAGVPLPPPQIRAKYSFVGSYVRTCRKALRKVLIIGYLNVKYSFGAS
jgi:hypothetical protein